MLTEINDRQSLKETFKGYQYPLAAIGVYSTERNMYESIVCSGIDGLALVYAIASGWIEISVLSKVYNFGDGFWLSHCEIVPTDILLGE